RYLISLLEPLYKKVGFADNLNDPHLDQLIRVQAISWMCSLDYKDCVTQVVSLFKRWMEQPADKSIISPNLKSAVYCTAIAEGGEDEWRFLWSQYLESNVASEKSTMMRGLGCSKEIWILSKYMKDSFVAGGDIRKQDIARVFSSVASNEYGQDVAWNYLRNNWKAITEYFGSGIFTLGQLVEYATNKFNSELMMQEIVRFRDANSDNLKSGKRTVDQSIERTKNNIAWMDAHYEDISKWLMNKGFKTL
ncbi:aminopeptidase N-like, partial [Hyalella azteca]|uniref:Aminopeptidase N-like n=1 Tax=Hyalella azteca TaxID=294128 RepID=A0A8B7NZA7_HYAAZ